MKHQIVEVINLFESTFYLFRKLFTCRHKFIYKWHFLLCSMWFMTNQMLFFSHASYYPHLSYHLEDFHFMYEIKINNIDEYAIEWTSYLYLTLWIHVTTLKSRTRGWSQQPISTPFVGIFGCNSVKSGVPISIYEHNPNNFMVGTRQMFWCYQGMSGVEWWSKTIRVLNYLPSLNETL